MDRGAEYYRRYLEGDDAGIVALIREYRDGLVFYLAGILGDAGEAEDAAEDTFVKLVTRRPRFSGRASFRTWLYAIGRNLALDRLRRRSRLAPLPEEAESGTWEELEERLIRSERREAVRRALGRLPGEYRQALILSYFEGFGNEETAKVMKKTRRQVENLLYRAKQSLKAELLKEGISDEDI